MKKLILALLTVFSVSAAEAQEGSWLLYGNANLNMVSVSGTSTTSFGINPGFGYQFNKNMTIGIQGGYSDIDTFSSYAVGAFYRYTHYYNNTFSFFGQADVSYMGDDYGGATLSSFGVRLMPAVAINVHNGFALNFGIGGINFVSYDGGLTTLDVTFGQQFNFGISKNFGCCKKSSGHSSGDAMRHKNMNDTQDDDEDDE